MSVPIDRSRITAEVYPGAANDIEAIAADAGGWRCEAHPWMPYPHDNCAGPGVALPRETLPSLGPCAACGREDAALTFSTLGDPVHLCSEHEAAP